MKRQSANGRAGKDQPCWCLVAAAGVEIHGRSATGRLPLRPNSACYVPGPVFGRRNWHASRADEARRSLNASSQDALWVPGDGRGIDRIDASSGVGEQHCGSGGENSPRDGPDSAYMRGQTVECARDQ